MNTKLMISLFILNTLLTSCSSIESKDSKNPEFFKDTVVSRSSNLTESPSWAFIEKTMYKEDGGLVYSLGTATIQGDQNIDAGFRIAEINAKANISKSIDQKMDFIFQHAEEGLEINNSIVRTLSAEASRLTTSGVIISNKYWEKIVTYDSLRNPKMFYKLYVRVSLKESQFENAIEKAIKGENKQVKLSKEFAEKVEKQLKEI